MADSISLARANSVLNAICKATAYSEAAIWVQLHTGLPGSAGTSNVAGNTTRVNASAAFGTAATTGTIANTVAVSWTSVSTSETYTHFSLWTASTVGTFILSGSVTTSAVTAGDNFSFPIGALTVAMTLAA